ncbi:hypothetical protein pb186bvf_010645 [Paramecium bursaria]
MRFHRIHLEYILIVTFLIIQMALGWNTYYNEYMIKTQTCTFQFEKLDTDKPKDYFQEYCQNCGLEYQFSMQYLYIGSFYNLVLLEERVLLFVLKIQKWKMLRILDYQCLFKEA